MSRKKCLNDEEERKPITYAQLKSLTWSNQVASLGGMVKATSWKARKKKGGGRKVLSPLYKRTATAMMAAPQAAPGKALIPAAAAVRAVVGTAGAPVGDSCVAVVAGSVTSVP